MDRALTYAEEMCSVATQTLFRSVHDWGAQWDEVLLADPAITWPCGSSTPLWWLWWTGYCWSSTRPSICAWERTADGGQRCSG